MRKKENVLMMVLVVLMLCLFMACDMPTMDSDDFDDYFDDDDDIIEEEDSIIQEVDATSTLFTEDPNEKGKYIFETDNTAYIKPNGYTLWRQMRAEAVFSEFEVTVKKTTGNPQRGYGVVFDERGHYLDDHSMLSILINIEGQYCIGEIDDGEYDNIEWWREGYAEGTTNNVLNKGYGAENKIKVSYDIEEEEYVLHINDSKIQNFEDPRDDDDDGGRSGNRGYVVVLSANEGFPYTSVRIEFSEGGTP